MADDDADASGAAKNDDAPKTWAGASKLLKRGESALTDEALFGDEPKPMNNDPHGYLGHFANDDVMKKGHNVGHKPKGKTPLVKSTATKGFRKLPGSASVVQGHAKYGEPDLGTRPPRHMRDASAKAKADMTRMMKKSAVMQHDPIPLSRAPMGGFGAPHAVSSRTGSMPPTPSDKKMSIRHHEDSIAYNRRHLEDHKRAMVKHERELKTVRRSLKKSR